MHEAYSHELIAAGFWLGTDELPEPEFYSYAMPPFRGPRRRDDQARLSEVVRSNGANSSCVRGGPTAADPPSALISCGLARRCSPSGTAARSKSAAQLRGATSSPSTRTSGATRKCRR